MSASRWLKNNCVIRWLFQSIFITGDSDDARFRADTFLRPALFEYLQRAASLPRLTFDWWRSLLLDPLDMRWSDLVNRFGGLVPTGLFDNTEVERFLRDIFTRRGRSNDFRELDAKLFVVAVELDSGEPVLFGADGWDDIPISRAVQASAAIIMPCSYGRSRCVAATDSGSEYRVHADSVRRGFSPAQPRMLPRPKGTRHASG